MAGYWRVLLTSSEIQKELNDMCVEILLPSSPSSAFLTISTVSLPSAHHISLRSRGHCYRDSTGALHGRPC